MSMSWHDSSNADFVLTLIGVVMFNYLKNFRLKSIFFFGNFAKRFNIISNRSNFNRTYGTETPKRIDALVLIFHEKIELLKRWESYHHNFHVRKIEFQDMQLSISFLDQFDFRPNQTKTGEIKEKSRSSTWDSTKGQSQVEMVKTSDVKMLFSGIPYMLSNQINHQRSYLVLVRGGVCGPPRLWKSESMPAHLLRRQLWFRSDKKK